MLYFAAATEMIIYLFAAPLVRLSVDKELDQYSFGIAFFFAFFFFLGGLLANQYGGRRERRMDIFRIPEKSSFKWILIISWILLCIVISIKYELYNRRIGTESAAELFANIPFIQLATFRCLEVSIPFLSSLVILEFYRDNRVKLHVLVVTVALIAVIFLLGAGSSRSWVGLNFLMVLVLIQNKLPKRFLAELIFKLFFISALIFLAVTALRINSGDERTWFEYISAEVLQRIDGLEVVSQIIEKHGYHPFGINPSAILNPIISSIPFLDAAIQLKLEALTTVKSVILDEELFSNLRDVNSFIILDVYYWGGLLGLALSAIIVGFSAKFVDLRIGITSDRVFQIFLVSVTVNLVVLEREMIGIFLSIIRDWIVLYFVSSIFLARSSQLSYEFEKK